MENTEEFLDWLVWMDIQHYKTEATPAYTPSGKSHFYLKGSPERFTSKEMIDIFNHNASDELSSRWMEVVITMSEHNQMKF